MEKYQEYWKTIPGYPNYKVSNIGRVMKIYKHHPNLIKRSRNTKTGYQVIMLSKGGVQTLFKVHRLVALAFIPNPNNYSEINHKNEDKTDNRVENLEWCTRKYNNNYGTLKSRIAKALSKPVLQLSIDGKVLKSFDSVREASRYTGISSPRIGHCCKHHSHYKTAGGFKWEYQ